MTAKPLLVGESNPYGSDPRYALYPSPSGCAGYNLARKILGMTEDDYLESFDRANLCVGKWSVPPARRAANLIKTLRPRCILLGAKVNLAFGMAFVPFVSAIEERQGVSVQMLVLPHPSGLCRLWHNPSFVERARRAVLKMCPELADVIGKTQGRDGKRYMHLFVR